MALLTEGPIARQAKAVYDAVFAKNQFYHDQIFRGVVLNNTMTEFQKFVETRDRIKQMPAQEKAVRDALVLQPHRFELTRSG